MNTKNNLFIRAIVVVAIAAVTAHADWVTDTIAAGTNPYAAAVNPVTNKTYVTNYGSGTVTVIDAANYYDTATITVGLNPRAIAVNALTNKIYVANFTGSSVTVIDGATDTVTSTVSVQALPDAIAINPTTNTIYVANYGSASVTAIEGVMNTVTTIPVGSAPVALCVNPHTNKIYVANSGSSNVTVIDGVTNNTASIVVGMTPSSIAANTVTNKIFVANNGSNNVTIIDGATNSTTTITAGTSPSAVAVNLVTDTVYVVNSGSSNVTVIDGATGTVATTVTVGTNPVAVAINTTTNKIYVVNYGSNTINIITGDSLTGLLNAGTNPNAVAVNTITNKIFAVNNGSANMTVIDGATNTTATVGTGTAPWVVAVNPVTNKIYIANYNDAGVTVIDGATNTTATVGTGGNPVSIAVNPVTNKIYVANSFSFSNNVTVIEGATNTTTTVATGTNPQAVAVNIVTNKIYVANAGSNSVTVIDGATNARVDVPVGNYPMAIAVNPVTNKIYVANQSSAYASVIDGVTNATVNVTAGSIQAAVAVNPITNKIYIANSYDGPGPTGNNITVIDGATNTTATIGTGRQPTAVAVNPVTNKIYVANFNSYDVTVIDGATNTTTTVTAISQPIAIAVNTVTNKTYVAYSGGGGGIISIDGATRVGNYFRAGQTPRAVAVNPVTNKIYVANVNSKNVTVIDEFLTSDSKVRTFFDSIPANSTRFAQPSLTGKAVSRLRPSSSGISRALSSMSTSQSLWGNSFITSGAGTDSVPWTWSWGTDSLIYGENFLCAVALDSQAASTNNPGLGAMFSGNMTVYPIYRFPPSPLVAPVLVSPLDNSINQSPSMMFTWGSVSDVTYYTLQVSVDSLFSSFVINTQVSTTSRTVSGLGASTTYFWRVNAGNFSGAGPWSSVWRFTTTSIGTPVLTSPANNAADVITTTLLAWNPIAGAISYSVQVATDSNFSSIVIDQNSITTTSYQATGLLTGTVYCWRANASNGTQTGYWSELRRFTTISTPPTIPVLLSPANNALGVNPNPVLSWGAAARAGSYTIQVSTASDFSSLIINDSDITTLSQAITGLSVYTLYYWRVQAENAVGKSSWSAEWNFVTGPDVPQTPNLVSPANNAMNQSPSITLIWNSISTATSYHIQVASDTGFTTLFLQDSLFTDSLKSITGLVNSTTYYWRVRAKNSSGVSAWSGVWSFMTVASGVLPDAKFLPRVFSITASSGTIRYALPKQCHVSLKYYDLRGRLVASFINQTQSPGWYSLHIDKAFNSPGTLIRVFEAGSFVKKELIAVMP